VCLYVCVLSCVCVTCVVYEKWRELLLFWPRCHVGVCVCMHVCNVCLTCVECALHYERWRETSAIEPSSAVLVCLCFTCVCVALHKVARNTAVQTLSKKWQEYCSSNSKRGGILCLP